MFTTRQAKAYITTQTEIASVRFNTILKAIFANIKPTSALTKKIYT